MWVFHAAQNGESYRKTISSMDDVYRLVGEIPPRFDSFTSSDGQYVFWLTSAHPSRPVNLTATALLLATSGFTPRNTPLLRGDVAITSSQSGQLAGLSQDQFDALCGIALSNHQQWQLTWRLSLDGRRQRRRRRNQPTRSVATLTDLR